MSYRTDFDGSFVCTPALTAEQCSILRAWSEERHEGASFPSIWCMWVPTDDGTGIAASDEEGSFYDYQAWLFYLVEFYLKPWGVCLDGAVHYQGEEPDDRGTLYVKDNRITDVPDTITRGPSPF